MIRRLYLVVAVVALMLLLPATLVEAAGPLHPQVKMETSLGTIVLELDGEKAPISTLNFIRYAEDGFYAGTVFHRVMATFMIQGGGFTADMEKKNEGLRSGIKNEWKNGLKNARGTISMARLGGQPDSATAQSFINVVDNASLDSARDGAAYAVFGKVVEGLEVVDKIRNTAVETHPKYGAGRNAVVPVETVEIKSVGVVGEWDRKAIESQVTGAEAAETKAMEERRGAEVNQLEEVIAKAEKDSGGKITRTDSGLMFVDLKVGDGESPNPTDRVEVHYTGWLTDGTKFDSSVDRDRSAKFPLNGVIGGWTEGVGSMKVGGKRRLIIPPELGYGDRGSPPRIPGGSFLVFDVELLSIN
jgi:peptidyl-prolyl cis-trans isomerase A (cyclophilin A)